MTIFDKQIESILNYYESLYDYYKTEFTNSPEGSLMHQMKGAHIQFLHYCTDVSGKKKRFGINSDRELIKALAKKEFDSRACNVLSNNIAALKEAADRQIPFDPDQMLKSMNKAYALLPEEYFFDRDKLVIAAGLDGETMARIKRHEKWWMQPYKEYWGHPENKTKLTSRGQKVRSISEILIAEALYKYSIPFHYEEVLEVNGKKYAPDFTFEGWNYKKFYLDYFGMMSDKGYARRNFTKLDEYYDIDLIPGDNLIVAFDSKGIMNMGVIEGIIKNEVIPRL